MSDRRARPARFLPVLVGLLAATGPAHGQGHHGHGGMPAVGLGPHHHHGWPMGHHPGGPSPGVGFFGASPFVVGLGGVFLPAVYVPVPVMPRAMPAPVVGRGGLMLPAPSIPAPPLPIPGPRPRPRPDSAKADGYVTLGDNLFRAGNNHRAEQRYLQAVNANPNSAAPRVRLAQLALVRGDYQEAAEQFRSATVAEPGWLVNATDVQALFAEPGDFAKALARLESHLQSTPNDRDGWLVLGAEWYLSGRTRQAADVFARLNDRKVDSTLAAFLDASTPDRPDPDPR